jgi:hypothetical protein
VTDPWFSAQQRNDAQWVQLVEQLDAALEAAVAEVLAKLWRVVLGERVAVTAAVDQPPDLDGAEQAARDTWQAALERWVRPILFAHYARQYAANGGTAVPERAREAWWADTLARVLPSAERVVQALRAEIASRPADGIPELRDRVARVLGLDAPTKQLRDEIAEVEAKLAALTTLSDGKRAELLQRRVGLQAELFRLRASRARSGAYNALAEVDPDNADQFRRLARQASRGAGDLAKLERDLARVDEQLLRNRRPPSAEAAMQEADLIDRRARLVKQARESEDTWRNTATRIARTESTNVLNDATLQRGVDAETDAGERMVKTWVAARDERVRPTHRLAHGQTVGVREKFRVGAAFMERPGDPLGPPGETVNCRCSIVVLTESEHKEIAAVLASAAPEEETVTDTTLEDLPPVMWHGVIAVEGVYTGDRRRFAEGSLRTQALPMPIRFQREDWGAHQGAVVVANLEGTRRYQNQIRAWGTFADGNATPEVGEVQGLMALGMMRGISVDGDDVLDSQFAIEVDADGNVFETFESMRLRSATFVAIPAFDEAEVFLGPPPEAWLLEGEELAVEQNDPDTAPVALEDLDALVADVSRMPEDLVDYWLGPEGSARVGGWGSPGSYTRCLAQLGRYVSPGQVHGACATLYHRATGRWPGRHADAADTVEAAAPALIASLEEVKFTADQFARRDLPGPTPLVVDDDGNVYGHIAAWGTCHTGFSDVCVTPPKSPSNYSLFHVGAVRLEDGTDLPVGKLTVSGSHANTKWGVRRTVEHYDNTATAAAVVRAYEDEHGIQVSGRIIPGTPPEKVAELRRSPISGDWRPVGNDMELVAALGVNAPGFPIPRTEVGMVDGRQMSLVAAGVLAPREVDENGAYVQRVQELAVLAGVDPASKVAALAASLPPMTEQEMEARAAALTAQITMEV